MIKLQIVGNLGKDCNVNQVNGKQVINFSVAHSEKFKNKEGILQERTIWVECAYWTDSTAIAQYLTKGKTVYAEGVPQADPYTDKENKPAATLRMRVQNIQLLGGGTDNLNPMTRSSQSETQAYKGSSSNQPQAVAMADNGSDDVPF